MLKLLLLQLHNVIKYKYKNIKKRSFFFVTLMVFYKTIYEYKNNVLVSYKFFFI